MSDLAERLIPSYVADVPRARAALDAVIEAAREEGRDEANARCRWPLRVGILGVLVIIAFELATLWCLFSGVMPPT